MTAIPPSTKLLGILADNVMRIIVKVKANSGKSEVVKERDYYKVFVKAEAKDGKANKEVLKLLKKYFKRDAIIISGFNSKEKLIEIIS